MCDECFKKYVEDKDEKDKCPFCNIEKKFKTTYFDMKGGKKTVKHGLIMNLKILKNSYGMLS